MARQTKKSLKEIVTGIVGGLMVFIGLFLIYDTLAYIKQHPNPKSEDYLKSRVVMLRSKFGSCSGQQVKAPSGTNYILSAGHCNVLAVNGSIIAVTEDGKSLSRRVVQEDPASDLLLLEALPRLEGLEVATFVPMHAHVRTFTHGAGHATYKTEGEIIDAREILVPLHMMAPNEAANCSDPKNTIMQPPFPFAGIDVCMLKVVEAASTAVIVPGSSGGLMVDDASLLVGVASASGDGFSYWATLKDIRAFLGNY